MVALPRPRWKRVARWTRIPSLVRYAWNAALSPLQPGSLVLLNSGRCGSTVLFRMLGAHPRVFSQGEVFARYHRLYGDRRRRPAPLAYLERERRRAGRRHLVFSVHFLRGQDLREEVVGLELESFLDAMPRAGVEHPVLLERRNALRVILSQQLARHRRLWHVKPGDPRERLAFDLDLEDIAFTPESGSLLDWLESFEREYAEARRLVAERGGLHLTYEEDVLPDPRIGYRKICARLGLPAVEVEVPLRRANPYPVARIVRNVEALEHALEGTRFAWMLDAE